jgi:Do/DeqQ family serine protease
MAFSEMKSRLLTVVLTAALTSLGTFFLAARYSGSNNPLFNATTKQLPVNYAGMGDHPIVSSTAPVDFQAAAEASVKAVVHIKTATKPRTVVANDPWDDFFGGMFGPRQYTLPPQIGSGSGVVISPDGYIVTNNHVVAGADQMTVTFNDRYTTNAKVISTDPSTDLAVVKVDEKNLPYMEFGNSDDVHLGQWVLAVGYPFSLDATVTAGIVSAKGRSLGLSQQNRTAIESYIQTDAAVNPGNSGGALVNAQGQLIGINSAIASPNGTYTGYSYAIPANIVRKVVGDLKQYGTVQRGYLGIVPMDAKSASPEQLTALGLDRTNGVYVYNVSDGSGADAAGLHKGDFITQIAGAPVATVPELLEQVARYKPGDHVAVTYLRDGREYNTTIELKNSAGTTSVIKNGASARLMGATLRSLTAEERRDYGITGGVLVTDLGTGPFTRTTMRKNFIITSVNDQAVSSLEDVQRIVASAGRTIRLAGFYHGYNGNYYYSITNSEGEAEQ